MKRAASLVAALIAAAGASAEPLTLAAARARALLTHPRITVAELQTLAAREQAVAARANYFPWVAVNATAVGTGEEVSRISAGALNNPQVLDRAGFGAVFTQLIADFGRTAGLSRAATAEARASATNEAAVRALLLAETDGVFFDALRSKALREVARASLENRKLVLAQISALATNKLKSELDVRFSQVAVAEARLLLDQSETSLQTALVSLAGLIGAPQWDELAPEEVRDLKELPPDSPPLVRLALARRPDLTAARLRVESARETARAERALDYPTVTAFGTGGITPLHDLGFQRQYSAAGVNLSLPVFTGGLYTARQKRSEALAAAADGQVRDLEIDVIRNVRVAWLEARHAQERIRTAKELVDSADEAYALAKARYDHGLSSIVELSQAQLNQTTAELTAAGARYTYALLRDRLDYETGLLQ